MTVDDPTRKYKVVDDKTVVTTQQTEKLTSEEMVKRYNSAVNTAIEKKNSVGRFNQQLEHTLDEYNFEMALLHALDEHEEQTIEDVDIDSLEGLTDSINKAVIKGYFRVSNIADEQEKARKDVKGLVTDVKDMYKYARKAADKTGAELEMKPEELVEELKESDQELPV